MSCNVHSFTNLITPNQLDPYYALIKPAHAGFEKGMPFLCLELQMKQNSSRSWAIFGLFEDIRNLALALLLIVLLLLFIGIVTHRPTLLHVGRLFVIGPGQIPSPVSLAPALVSQAIERDGTGPIFPLILLVQA